MCIEVNCICCFAGHGNLVYNEDIKNKIYNKCHELIVDFDVNEFWVGNYGNFDKTAAHIIRELKLKYPNIELNLIIPYITKKITKNKEWYYKKYDNIIIADFPASTPYRYGILKCCPYMVNNSKYL